MAIRPEGTRRARELEEELRRDWLGRQQAAKLMDVSGEYIHHLARTDRIATLTTPLGKLYRRVDVERISGQRESDRQVREQRRGASLFDSERGDGRDDT
jgi:hypothetical protein